MEGNLEGIQKYVTEGSSLKWTEPTGKPKEVWTGMTESSKKSHMVHKKFICENDHGGKIATVM